jgi:sodium transport system permease protein
VDKDRGTLATLLTARVPADQLLTGKIIAAGLMGVIAAALNLLSMLLTFQSGVLRFGSELDLQFQLPLHSVAIVFAVLLLLAVLFSALFLGIAVRSHSFKEAQNSLTPVYIVSLVPAMLAMMPGIAFTPAMALIPVGGVAFLFRDLMGGQVAMEPAILAVGSTIVYTMAALVFAARAFGREDVLFGAGRGEVEAKPLAERFRTWRRSAHTVPGPGAALLLIALVGVLFFYLGRPLLLRFGEPGLILSQLLILAVPAFAFCLLGRHDLRATLALRGAPPGAFLAAFLVILGGIPIGWGIAWLQGFVLEIPVEYLQALEQLVTAADAGGGRRHPDGGARGPGGV